MALEIVGYRRLYDAMGCSLSKGEEFHVEIPLAPPMSGSIYLGPKPRFGISFATGERYIVPGDVATTFVRVEHQADPAKSTYPRHFFTEICITTEKEVADDLSAAFRAHDKNVSDRMLAFAESHQQEMMTAADLLGGVVGLRFHRQFVLKVMSESLYAQVRGSDWRAIRSQSPSVEVLESIALNDHGVSQLPAVLKALGSAKPEAQRSAGEVVQWLLKAWAERDSIGRFLALFVPLEMVLEGADREPAGEWAALSELVQKHGAEQSRDLLAFLDKRKAFDRPSLSDRFEALAKQSAHPGWETDVEAFRKFNRIRNNLLHRGQASVQVRLTVGDNETRDLEDFVERYVSLRLFGDMQVYKSRYRVPLIRQAMTLDTPKTPEIQ